MFMNAHFKVHFLIRIIIIGSSALNPLSAVDSRSFLSVSFGVLSITFSYDLDD